MSEPQFIMHQLSERDWGIVQRIMTVASEEGEDSVEEAIAWEKQNVD